MKARPPLASALPLSDKRFSLRALVRQEHLQLRLAGAAGLSALAGLAGLALTATSIWLISRAAEHPNVQALAIAVVGVRLFALARSGLRYLERLSAHDCALRLLAGLRTQVFAALRPLGPSVLHSYRRGDLLRRFVGDVDGLQDGLVRAYVPMVGASVTAVGACLICALLVPLAGLILSALLVIAALLLPWATSRAAGHSAEVVRLAGYRDGRAAGLVDGLGELIAYGAASAAVDHIASVDKDIRRRSSRLAAAAAAGTGLTAALAAVALPAVLAAGAAAVHSGSLPGIDLGVLAICVLAAFEAVAPLPSAFAAWTRCRAGLARVAAVLDAAPAFVDPMIPATVASHGVGVEMHGVRLRPSITAPELLDHLDLRIESGSRTTLVGASGSGKSTVLAAILRLLAVDVGTVRIIGDSGTADLTMLRAADMPPLVAGSLQGDHVFDASLRDNLRIVRPDASDADLDAVAARAGLAAFIDVVARAVGHAGGGRRRRPCPAANGNDCCSRALCSPTRRSWCWTSRPRTSTPRPRPRCSPIFSTRHTVAPS